MSLSGKTAIVSGASRGIGAEIAFELAKRGANVMISYTTCSSKPLVEALIARIESLSNGTLVAAVQADLRDPDSPRHIITATVKAFPATDGKIDILVNNAGVALCKLLAECSDRDISAVFDVNVFGTMKLTRAVIPYLRVPGRIINISSIAARRGGSGFSVYSASKAALEGFTRSLAYELGHEGHTVNCVQPGPVESDMLQHDIPEDVVAYMKMGTAVAGGQRVGTPEDIARVVVFLASGESGWVSGECISASGGFHMN